MSHAIAVDNLTKTFGALTAVDHLTFNVPEGICFGLLGPNGAGKTTTIEMLEGILPPTTGQIRLFGEPASKDLYKRVGIQFQSTALPDYLKVGETLKMFAALYERSADLSELMSMCALTEFAQQDARRLSGGQRQRLLLALALINDPDLIFLDEPTTGLDPQARRNFWELIGEIKRRGKTVVLTTHYMDEAQILCDDIAIMDQGRIIERGAPQALLSQHFQGALVYLPEANLAGRELDRAHFKKEGGVELITDQVDDTLQWLMAEGISLDGLRVQHANLEDLFLKLTGHTLRS
ncbi:ABC transporter ATP-binding protein [Reinekea blandensis]|uniref:ABC transporter, ATP-binding protein n=1 Tax=Reinekea blandensis MED297 TaxID=314283 RepID=A4BGB4_9GAMM|nr:ABC transporter ATP-binding protein [Reinekea blandensis]EAR08909.1 ABC transporter, ATP-binding protein [Reinekea sp. MED297] [Reinekea blandensis MED297]